MCLNYLLKKEWSLGNNQCPECFGRGESWLGHPSALTPDLLGHKLDCELARNIESCGGNPLFLGESKLTDKYEVIMLENGIITTRLVGEDVEGHNRADNFLNNFFDGILNKAISNANCCN